MPQKEVTLTYDDCIKVADRIYSMIDTSAGPDECHPHTSPSEAVDGYGRINMIVNGKRRYMMMTRVLYVLMTKEDLLSSDCIDHNGCGVPGGNPNCCNFSHIQKTDKKGNAATMMRDDTRRGGRGRGIFTDEQVIEYRKRHQAGEKVNDLAREAGVRYHGMNKLIRGRSYKHLPLFPRPVGVGSKWEKGTMGEYAASIVKARLLLGHKRADIARDAGISRGHVRQIVYGNYWGDVDPAPLDEVRAMFEGFAY